MGDLRAPTRRLAVLAGVLAVALSAGPAVDAQTTGDTETLSETSESEDTTASGDPARAAAPALTYRFADTGPTSTVEAEIELAEGVSVSGVERLRVLFDDGTGAAVVAGVEERFDVAAALNEESELPITATLELDGRRLADGTYTVVVELATLKEGEDAPTEVEVEITTKVAATRFATAPFAGSYQLDETLATFTVDAAVELRDDVTAEQVNVVGWQVARGEAATVVLAEVSDRFTVGSLSGERKDAKLPVTVTIVQDRNDRLAAGDYVVTVQLQRTDADEEAEIEIKLNLPAVEPALAALREPDTPVAVQVEADDGAIAVPITLRRGLDVASLSLDIESVARGANKGVQFEDFFALGDPAIPVDAAPPDATLSLEIAYVVTTPEGERRALEPETYTVNVRLDHTEPAGDAADGTLTDTVILPIKVAVPKAALASLPAKVLIKRTDDLDFFGWSPWFTGGDDEPTATELTLRETDNGSRVADLRLLTDQTFEEARFAGGDVDFAADVIVPRGDTTEVPLVLTGEYPLGTVTGTLTLTSPQLAGDVSTALEIRSVRPTGLIGWIVVLGVLAALVLRSFLGWVINWARGRWGMRRSIAALEEKAKDHPDDKFRAEIAKAVAKLKPARDSSKWYQYDFSKVIAEGAELLKAAQTGLNNRSAAVKAQIANVAAGCVTPGTVPKVVEDFLRPIACNGVVRTATEQFEEGKVETARTTIEPAQQAIDGGIVTLVGNWRSTTLQRLDALGPPDLVPKELREQYTQRRAAARQAVAAVPVAKTPLPALVAALSAARTAVEKVLDDAVSPVVVELAAVVRALSAGEPPPPVTDLRAAVNSLAAALRTGIADPDAGLEATAGILQDALDKTGVALKTHPDADPVTNRLTDDGEYAEAAREIRDRRGAGFMAPQGDEPMELPSARPTIAADTPEAPEQKDRESDAVAAIPEAVPRPIMHPAYWLARAIQFAAVVVFLIVIAIGWFEDTFVGTLQDMAAIFFWAFTIDLGLEQLTTNTIKGLAKMPS